MHVVATAGHVDHGKSTLVEALTGTNPDRFIEEKTRGLTIDLGFASTKLPSGAVLSLVDVPGHVRFIKNMLAGVGTVDACLFVVATTEGWKPQSEEHLRILELLGIKHGVVALTKADLVDPESIELARLDVEERVFGTFLAGAPIVTTDAPTGFGLADLRAELDTLLELTPSAEDRNRPRLWIDRSFAAKGAGTVVTGTLTGGKLQVGDALEVQPIGAQVRIRGLQNHYSDYAELLPGTRSAVNLAGIPHGNVQRGDSLIRTSQWHMTRVVDASLKILDQLDHVVSRRGAHVAYLGTGEYSIQMRILGPTSLEPGQEGYVRLFLPRPLPLLPGDRFVLRESGRFETLGGGSILDVDPRVQASRARPDRSIDRVIRERGWIDANELERLTGEHRVPNVSSWVVDPVALKETLATLHEKLDAAGPMGLALSVLDKQERAAMHLLKEATVQNGRLVIANLGDPLAGHPFISALQANPFAPPEPKGIDRAELRELVRRGVVVEESGIFFAASALAKAAQLAAQLLKNNPKGFTVSSFREAAGTTRKHAMPLLVRLDSTGVTRRRDSLRIAGPRLPKLT